MSVRRLRKARAAHTVLLNSTIDAIREPLALAVYAHLMTKPDDWQISRTEICRRFDMGRHSYLKAMQHLREVGLLTLERHAGGDKAAAGSSYILHYEPQSRQSDSQTVEDLDRLKSRPSEISTVEKSDDIQTKDSTPTKDSEQTKETPNGVDPQAWQDFDEFRRSSAKLRKGWTDLGQRKAANLLRELTPEQQREVVNYSIVGGYTGLFPDRLTRSTTQQPQRRSSLQRAVEAFNGNAQTGYLEGTDPHEGAATRLLSSF